MPSSVKFYVSFYFSILDNKSNLIESTQSLRSNVFIKDVTFDVLDIDGSTILPEYMISANTSFLLSENENMSIFGDYKKDFGIRAKVSNNFNSDLFISEYVEGWSNNKALEIYNDLIKD